jgi:hypothetical protein
VANSIVLRNPTTRLKMDNESVRKMKTHSGDLGLRFIYRRIDVECVMAPQDDMEKGYLLFFKFIN